MCKLLAILFFLGCTSAIHAQTSIDSGYAAVNNTKLYYEVAGRGEPLVLIHGSFGDRRFWDPQFEPLSKKFRVIRYDIRGYGRSAPPNPEEKYTDAADLKSLLDFLKIDKANLCGLSLGSIIAVDLALAYPGKCKTIILCGPRVAGDATEEYKSKSSDSIRSIIAKTTEIVRSQGARAATDYLWTGDHAMGKTLVSDHTRSVMLGMGYEYSWWRYLNSSKREQEFPLAIKKLSEIKIPTLIITAEYDLDLCKEIATLITKQIPNTKLVSIKGAGHIMNIDQPKRFNRIIKKFISG